MDGSVVHSAQAMLSSQWPLEGSTFPTNAVGGPAL